jgi:hypothetical protein
VTTYSTIAITVNRVTLIKEDTPAADVALVFCYHKSNETGHTELEYGLHIEERGALTVIGADTRKCQSEGARGCENAGNEGCIDEHEYYFT